MLQLLNSLLTNKNKIKNSAEPKSLVENLSLDPSYSYFLLSASFGDKWCILSFLPQFLRLHANVRIIASERDFDLARVFLSTEEVIRSFVFFENEFIINLSNSIDPNSSATYQLRPYEDMIDQTKGVLASGFPANTIRHLHIVKYPYFGDLHLVHGVSYGTLLKMLLYLPPSCKSVQPDYYSPEDFSLVEKLLDTKKLSVNKKFALFNIVNYSHHSFSNEQILLILHKMNGFGFNIYINVTDGSDFEDIERLISGLSFARTLAIPGHLLALVCKKMDAVIGIIGGAMNVAVMFSQCHCLTFYAEPRGFKVSLDELFGGLYGENLWKMYDKEWPCIFSKRVLQISDIKSPADIDNSFIEKAVSDFCLRIS